MRDWHDEAAAAVTLHQARARPRRRPRRNVRSPKQVEIRAKARGLKVPNEMIVSHPSGVSLVRSENARAPVPGRSELVRTFSAALQPSRREARMTKTKPDHDDDHEHDHDNDNDPNKGRAPAPAGGALASLAALGTA